MKQFENAEHCVNCGAVIPEGRQHCKLCETQHKAKKQTNFERIKAMSVEELAELLNNITEQCCECGYYDGCVEKCTFNMFGTCEQSNIQKWLESEVTE